MTLRILALGLFSAAAAPGQTPDGYPQRRAAMLARLAEQNNDAGNVARYVLGKDVAKANAYFAKAPTIDFDNGNWYVRAWYAGRPHMDRAAKDGLLKSIQKFRDGFVQTKEADFPSNPKAPGPWTENHQFRHAIGYVLMAQIVGPGKRHDFFVEYLRAMLRDRLAKGFGEYHSPKYLHETCEQLTALADWGDDPNLKLGARMCLDALWADVALTSLRGHRPGPAVRLASNNRADTQRTDTLCHEWANYYFGWRPEQDKPVRVAVDSYVPPAAIFALAADVAGRGSYEVRNRNWFHADRHDKNKSDQNVYFYMTPAFGMGAAQNRMPTKAGDRNSVQTWEVVTTDPDKSLGGYVKYVAGTNGKAEVPSTANMHYKNVIFYSGDFLDYKGNLGSGGGAHERKLPADGRELHLYRVTAPGGDVYVGVMHHPRETAGVVEVRAAAEAGSWDQFVAAIEGAPGKVADGGRATRYTSTAGDRIEYAVGENGEGKGTVNGEPFPLTGYPHYDSPFVRSRWGGGTTTISYPGYPTVVLDYQNQTKFQRREGDAEAAPGGS